jgi:hypothetical protein
MRLQVGVKTDDLLLEALKSIRYITIIKQKINPIREAIPSWSEPDDEIAEILNLGADQKHIAAVSLNVLRELQNFLIPIIEEKELTIAKLLGL